MIMATFDRHTSLERRLGKQLTAFHQELLSGGELYTWAEEWKRGLKEVNWDKVYSDILLKEALELIEGMRNPGKAMSYRTDTHERYKLEAMIACLEGKMPAEYDVPELERVEVKIIYKEV
jgi:hypothetical protein